MGDPQGKNAAVQKDMTVRAFWSTWLMIHGLICERLQVHFHKNHHHHDLRRRGLDCHLSEPDRGPCPLVCVRLCNNLMKTQPKDLVNQSIPFSYLAVDVAPNDGSSHSVQLYTDVSGEWLVPGNLPPESQLFLWETTIGDTVNHQFLLQNQTQFLEVDGRVRYGNVTYSTKKVPSLPHVKLCLCLH